MTKQNVDLRPSQRLARISAQTGKPLDKFALKDDPSVFRAAGRSAEFYDHLRVHYRETRRSDADIDASVKVILKDGAVWDTGTAKVINISPSGALLAEFCTTKKTYPVAPFKMEMVLSGGDYTGIGIEARPVRFEFEHGGLGVKFEEIFVAAD